MAEAPYLSAEPGTSHETPDKDKDAREKEQDNQISQTAVVRRNELRSSIEQLIIDGREGMLPTDVQVLKEQEQFTAIKLQLYEYHQHVIEYEKQLLPGRTTEQLEWDLNRNQRQLLFLRRQLLREEAKGQDEAPKLGPPAVKQQQRRQRTKASPRIEALKQLISAHARLVDDISLYVKKPTGELLEPHSITHKRINVYHHEQVAWHQKMLVWNLQELRLPERTPATEQEDQELLLKNFRGVVDSQKELVKMQTDQLNQRRREASGEGGTTQEISSEIKGDPQKLDDLITEQTRLIKECPTHYRSGQIQYVDVMMQKYSGINARWEVIFEHQKSVTDKKKPPQELLVKALETLRQQVYSLRKEHEEFLKQAPELRSALDEEILHSQRIFWRELIEKRTKPRRSEEIHHAATPEVHRKLIVEAGTSDSEHINLPGRKLGGTAPEDGGARTSTAQEHIQAPPSVGPQQSPVAPGLDIEGSDVRDEEKDESTPSTSTDLGAGLRGQLSHENPSTPATHLQSTLAEYAQLTAQLSQSELIETIFQLSYIAIAYFDKQGGSLSLGQYKVRLYIPRGAIPEGPPKLVYIYVNPDAPPIDGLDPPNVALSPMIQCGPPGLTFSDTVVLSFPHHATEDSGWQLDAKVCHNEESDSKVWQALDPDVDGLLVSSRGNRVVLLMTHFTGVALVGRPSAFSSKVVATSAFGGNFQQDQDDFAARIHVWDNNPVAKKKVLDKESEMDSKMLDVSAELEVYYNQGDVKVEIKHVREGWEIEAETLQAQAIPKYRLWRYTTNSTTFDLTRSPADETEAVPRCDGLLYQLSSESSAPYSVDKVRLSIRPRQTNGSRIKRQKCSTGEDCSSRHNDNPKTALAQKAPGMIGNYGGVSPEAVETLSGLLDPEGRGSNLTGLADRLGIGRRLADANRQRITSRADLMLKCYLALCQEDHVQGKDAVAFLVQVLRQSEYPDSAQVLEEDMAGSKCTAGDMRSTVKGATPHKRLSLPDHTFSSEITDELFFQWLAEELGKEWKKLATNLGVKNAKVDKIIQNDPGDVEQQIFKMLIHWKQTRGTDGQRVIRELLADGLKKVGRPDLAAKIDECSESSQQT